MLREYPCPGCGFTINSWAQLVRCPRCTLTLPRHDVDLPVPGEVSAAEVADVDYFQRRRGAEFPDDDLREPLPWYGRPVVLVVLATILSLLLLGIVAWLVLGGSLDGAGGNVGTATL